MGQVIFVILNFRGLLKSLDIDLHTICTEATKYFNSWIRCPRNPQNLYPYSIALIIHTG